LLTVHAWKGSTVNFLMTGRILQIIFAPTTRKESALTEVDAGTNMSKLPGLIHLLHLRPLCLGHLLLQLPTLLPVLFFLVSRKEIWAQFLLHL
jgi:hypothetical protein